MSHHDSTHNARKGGSPFLPAVWVFCLVFLILVGALMFGRSKPATEIEDEERAATRIKTIDELQTADMETLTTYGWNDRAKGVVRIPITRAMELVIPSLNASVAKITTTTTTEQKP